MILIENGREFSQYIKQLAFEFVFNVLISMFN